MGEFLSHIPNYRANTIDTVRLALAAREHLFSMAEREGIDFDLERRGILHIYKHRKDFDARRQGQRAAAEGGLDRRGWRPTRSARSSLHCRAISMAASSPRATPGDIHKFTRGWRGPARDVA